MSRPSWKSRAWSARRRPEGAPLRGRPTGIRTWMRTADGWRIVAAYVSLLGETTLTTSWG
ncbi:MAG: DUF3225 domain-containing protein [Proteobacteria bacterium]|nr:DUF3225 domain-containing protein [Pseudomonadota bacterium]